jgi:uncharacterized protein involved in exopolysaccharide biosynthesis
LNELQATGPSLTPHSQDSSAEAEDEISLLDLLQVVVENLRLLVLGPLAAGLLALGVSFIIAPTFTASVKFMPPQQQQSAAAGLLQSLGALGGLAGAASGIKNPSDQYIAFLKSRSVQDALIDRFDLLDRYEARFKQDARKTLEANVKATAGKDGLISVEVEDKDPQFAANLANAHVEELHKLLARLAVTEAQQRRVFFEKQLDLAKTNLVRSEQALKSSGVNSSSLKANPAAAVAGMASLKAALTAQEIKVANMRGYLTESAPLFKQAQNELMVLRQQITKAETQDATKGADASIGGMGGVGSTGPETDYIARYRDFKYHETLFELMAKQYEIARVDESREGAVIQVVDPAFPPERKSKPKKALIAMISTLATGFALLLWVFVRQALRNASKDGETSQKLKQLHAAWRRALGRR